MGELIVFTGNMVRRGERAVPVKLSIAMRLGALSFDAGLPVTACPFRMIAHREQYQDWVNGWHAAELGSHNDTV